MKTQQRGFARGVGSLLTILFFAMLGPAPAWSQTAGLAVPGFGPGLAGNVSRGPTSPACQVNIPCTRPFAGATVLVVDSTDPASVVGTAVANPRGNFIVSVP